MNSRLTTLMSGSNLTHLAVLFTLVVGFTFDLSLALGVAGGVTYIIPVLLTLNIKSKQATYFVSVLAIALTIIGFVFSPAGGELWKVLANRSLAIFAVISVAIVIIIIKNKNEALRIENEQLQVQTEKALTASKAKSRFLSAMSHEFKTPLNIIIGFTDLLKFSSSLDRSEQENLEHISAASSSLLGMVEGAISYAKVQYDEQAQKKIPTYIIPLVNSLIDSKQALLDKKKLKLSTDFSVNDDLVVITEPSLLTEILTTILINALQYTPDLGQVTVSIEVCPESSLRVSISDSGQGIPEKYHHEVFKPFSRLRWENSSKSGLGLGLAKAKLLCDLLTINIDYSCSQKGTTFWLDIPLSQS